MYATEFKTIINEPYIQIPNYEEFKGHEVRVVLLNIDKKNKTDKNSEDDFIEYLANNPIKLDKDIKFLSREEANER